MVVVDVELDSSADEAGVIAGDVILEINKQAIRNMSDYDRVTRGLKGNALIRTARGYFLVKGEE